MAMTLRLRPEDERALTELAEAEGVSKQEATVRAIHEAVSRRQHQGRVRDLSAAARERYADVLDRLSR
ncbi:MAG: CopG family transcriptional regulator [Tessaracoccus sp.]